MKRLGKRVAPARFVLFGALMLAGLAVLIPWLGTGLGTMAAFDIAALVFVASLLPMLGSEADDMRRHAEENDANRALLLALTGLVTVVILAAVAGELRSGSDRATVTLVIATLVLAWLFTNTVYALHYAHLFYTGDEHGKDVGGLQVPGCDEPDYWDFLYFSVTLGMTFQTSDVTIVSAAMRRTAIGHTILAFVFNLGVVAFTINVLGSG